MGGHISGEKTSTPTNSSSSTYPAVSRFAQRSRTKLSDVTAPSLDSTSLGDVVRKYAQYSQGKLRDVAVLSVDEFPLDASSPGKSRQRMGAEKWSRPNRY